MLLHVPNKHISICVYKLSQKNCKIDITLICGYGDLIMKIRIPECMTLHGRDYVSSSVVHHINTLHFTRKRITNYLDG